MTPYKYSIIYDENDLYYAGKTEMIYEDNLKRHKSKSICTERFFTKEAYLIRLNQIETMLGI